MKRHLGLLMMIACLVIPGCLRHLPRLAPVPILLPVPPPIDPLSFQQPPPVLDPAGLNVTARRGVVRIRNHTVTDDDGPFLAHGATLFWAWWGQVHTPTRLDQNLAWLSARGIDYIRTLGMVGGPWWDGRQIDPHAADYLEQYAALVDRAYDRYGLRTQITLFGDSQYRMPDQAARRAFASRVVRDLVKPRPHKIFSLEVANEGWQNGFAGNQGIADAREIARVLVDELSARGLSSMLVSITAPFGFANDDRSACDEVRALYEGSAANTISIHFSRDDTKVEGVWRHTRLPWDWDSCQGTPGFGINNEPVGPGSSVAETSDAYAITAAAVNSYIAGMGAYTYHSEAGVWGGLYGASANLWEHRNADQILTGLQAMDRYLPRDLPNWQKTQHGRSDHPFAPSWSCRDRCTQIWPDGITSHGVVRAYAAYSGTEFVVMLTGIKERLDLTAAATMTAVVIDPATGTELASRDMQRGDSWSVGGKPALVVKGRYR